MQQPLKCMKILHRLDFFRDDALELINSLVSGKNESFSTLDICTVDKYTGKAEFIKIGAVSTFILKRKGVEILKIKYFASRYIGKM